VNGVLIDLTARAYDGIEATEVARAAGKRVFAVGQHEDVELRRRARAAGAVFVPYRRLTDEGGTLVGSWMSESETQETAT
jgi:hypothetical protein